MCYPQLLYRSAEDAFSFAPSTQNQAVIAPPEAVEDMFRNATVYVSLSDYMAFLLLLTETICLLYLLNSFLEPRFKGRRWMTLVIGLFYFIAVPVQKYGTYGETWSVLVHLLLLIGVIVIFYIGSASEKIYLIITFWALVCLCRSLWFFVANVTRLSGVFWRFPDVVIKEVSYWPFKRSSIVNSNGYNLTLETGIVFGLVLTCIVLALSTRKLVKGMKNNLNIIRNKELLFLLMPSFTGLIVYLFLEITKKFLFFQIAVEWATDYGIVLYVLIPLLIVTTMLCILYAYDIYQQILEYIEDKGRAVMLEQEMGQMQNHIREIEQLYSGIRSVKHDMQNYLFDIKSLLAAQGILVEEGTGELGNYLAGIGKSLDTFNYSLHTGNPVTDVVLNGKLKQAEALGIAYECSFLYPSDCGISVFDISIILNNAINNALEACQNLKTVSPDEELIIEISSYCKNNMLFIVIRNSFDGILNQDPSGSTLATRKSEPGWHGLGFQNIRKSAEKYYGSADYEVRGKQFILTVMMQKGDTGQ